MKDFLHKIPRQIWVLLIGLILFFPQLHSFGLWAPSEVNQADLARDVVESGFFAKTLVDPNHGINPPLHSWVVGLGFKIFGVNELAGRLPIALCGLLTLFLVFRVGQRLFNENAGLAAAFVLATTPTFLFQSRQLTSEVIFYACLVASAGGLASFLWPIDKKQSYLDLIIGSLGLIGGFLAKGMALGFLFPLVCLAIAIAMSWKNSYSIKETSEIESTLENPDSAAISQITFGQVVKQNAFPLACAIGAAFVTIGILYFSLKGGSLLFWGAIFRKLPTPPTFETAFRDLGFATYPWIAVAPIALFLFVQSQKPQIADRTKDAFAKILILLLCVFGYLIASIWIGFFGEIRYPALPWLCIAIGIFCHDAWTNKTVHPFWGLVALGFILILHQDFYVSPESLVFSHLLQPGKYPVEMDIKIPVRLFGVLFCIIMFFALWGAPNKIPKPQNILLRIVAAVPRFFGWLLRLWHANGHGYWLSLCLLSFFFAAWCSFYLTPQLSLHMSNKALFETFHQCKQGNEKLSQYMVSGRGADYYNHGKLEQVGNQQDLFALFKKPERAFVLVPSNQLAVLDRAAREEKLPYYVLDDRNSQYLILSNRLAGNCNQDLNPLRKYVVKNPPTPRKRLEANFENRVHLLGYDVDDVVRRPGKFKITLYFHVKSAMPSNYKIFIHFDQPGSRFHGDHEPLGEKYPTQYWLPEDYVIDPHEVEIPLLTTPGGTYTMYMGFWLGSARLKVLSGPADNANRVRLGTIQVR